MLNGYLLTTVASRNMAFIRVKFKLKRENLGPQHGLTKCALENKLLNQNC